MLAVLPDPAFTVVLTAALTGLRKSELRGLNGEDFTGAELSVRRSVWNSITNEPKTNRSKAPIPVVKQLAEALEAHRLRMGKLAAGPIFQAGHGKPLNLDNLVRRIVMPALERCEVCRKHEDEHKPEAHIFKRDDSLPRWHGWHAFRRGLATNLHALGVEDKTIQAILAAFQHRPNDEHLRKERRGLASGRNGRAKRKVGNMQQSCNAKEDSVRLSLVESLERRGSSVVEQPIRNRQVAGSSPALGSNFSF